MRDLEELNNINSINRRKSVKVAKILGNEDESTLKQF